jgi:type III secretion protein D
MNAIANIPAELSSARQTDDALYRFVVTGGVNTSASYALQSGRSVTCGTDFGNDIMVSLHDSAGPWQAELACDADGVYLTLLEGSLESTGHALLMPKQQVTVDRNDVFSTGTLSFSIEYAAPASTNEPAVNQQSRSTGVGDWFTARGHYFSRHLLYAFSILCVGLAILSGMYAVTGSLILVNADTSTLESTFPDQLREAGLGHLQVDQQGEGKYRVFGAVDNSGEKNRLQRIAQNSGADVTLQVKVNDQMLASVEDIFRVNGVQGKATIIDANTVSVSTSTGDTAQLDAIRQLIRRDIPALAQLEIVNSVPVIKKPAPKKTFKPNPEKRITLIAGGANAYIMTQDKSRYFVGALLPSGHLVEEIRQGVVIVSKDGKRETLKY